MSKNNLMKTAFDPDELYVNQRDHSSYKPDVNSYFIGVIFRKKDDAIVSIHKTEAETLQAFECLPDDSGLDFTMINIGYYLCYLNDFQKAMRSWMGKDCPWPLDQGVPRHWRT